MKKFEIGEIYCNPKYMDIITVINPNTGGSKSVYVINLIVETADYFAPDSVYANNLIYLGTDLSVVKLQYPEYFI
jgi:hypothetical protein